MTNLRKYNTPSIYSAGQSMIQNPAKNPADLQFFGKRFHILAP